MGTMIAFFLLLHPSFGPEFPPGRKGAENYFFPDRDGEMIDKLAREILALMASLESFLLRAGPDRANLAILE
jgi:hypothetical protein